MNQLRHVSRRMRGWTCIRASLLALLLSPCAAFAQATLNPYVSAQFEHDSNVFRIRNSTIATEFYGSPQMDDTDLKYVAGVEGTYLWGGLQKFSGTLEGRKIDYDHFDFLDHTEYLANLQLDWKLGSLFDGVLQARQEHVAASFADRDGPGLEIDTDRNIVAKLNLRFRTDWRLETGVNFHTYDAPLQFYPDFVEHETGTHLGLSYLGITNLSYGFGVDHIDGNYVHAVGVGPYNQTSVALKANYAINGLSAFSGAIGYTHRNQSEESDSFGAVTGQLKYIRQLTGKTSVNVQVVRAVNSYVASAGSEIDTTGSVGATWQATYKLSIALTYSYTANKYIGQIIPGSLATGRTDHSPAGGVNIIYQALRQLQLKAYLNQQSRTSTYDFDRYSDVTAGIQVLAHWR